VALGQYPHNMIVGFYVAKGDLKKSITDDLI
jgi:hypothetical protein